MMLSVRRRSSFWVYVLFAYLMRLSVDAVWPAPNLSQVQLLGIFGNDFNSTNLSSESLQSRAMFISAVLLSQQYNITVNEQYLSWQSIGSRGNVMNAVSRTCELMATTRIAGIVGPPVSRESHVIAPFTAMLRIPLISYASTDPDLSDRTNYPTFYRTVPSDDMAALAIAQFFVNYNWTSAIIIHQNDAFGSNGAKVIGEAFMRHNLAITETIVFDIVARAIRGDLKSMLTSSATRLVILWAQTEYTLAILHKALEADVLGPQFTWILSSRVPLDPFNGKWNVKLVGMFLIEPVVGKIVNAPINNTLLDEAYQMWTKYEPTTFPGRNRVDYYAQFAFDAAWTLIQSLGELCSGVASCISFLEAPLCFGRQLLHSEEFFNRINNITFLGVSGAVQFRSNDTDRASGAYYVLSNVQDLFTGLAYVPVAMRSEANDWSPYKPANVIVWPGTSLKPPTGHAAIAGVKLRIVVIETAPFTMLKTIEGEDGQSTKKLVGYIPELIDRLQEKMHFDKNITILHSKDTDYDGLMDAVANNTYDLVIGDVTIVADRREKVGFSSAIYDNALRLVVRNTPDTSTDWFFYLRPFEFRLRLVILTIVVLSGLLIFLFEGHRHPVFRRTHYLSRLPLSLWYSSATMTGYSADFHVHTAAGRMIALGLYIACYVLTAAYQANLTANITTAKSQGPISGIDDIKTGKVSPGRIGIIAHSSIEGYYLREISDGSRNFYPLHSKEDMFEKLLDNVIDVSIMDSGVLEYSINGIYCNLTLVGPSFDRSAFGIVYRKNWIYEQVLDVTLLSLRGSGVLDEMRTRWFETQDCSGPTQNPAETLLESTVGLFVLVGVIFVLALPLYLWHNREYFPCRCCRSDGRTNSRH